MSRPLTAELFARAIIASAASMGDLATPRTPNSDGQIGIRKRHLRPAAVAVALEAKRPLTDICRILQIEAAEVAVDRHADKLTFQAAKKAAREAIALHLQTLEPTGPTVETAVEPGGCAPAVFVTEPAPTPSQEPQPVAAPRPAAEQPVRRASHASPILLRDQILDQLRGAPATAPNLAILTDAKELVVSDTLRNLEREGVVTPGPIPPHGVRHRHWALTSRAAA